MQWSEAMRWSDAMEKCDGLKRWSDARCDGVMHDAM